MLMRVQDGVSKDTGASSKKKNEQVDAPNGKNYSTVAGFEPKPSRGPRDVNSSAAKGSRPSVRISCWATAPPLSPPDNLMPFFASFLFFLLAVCKHRGSSKLIQTPGSCKAPFISHKPISPLSPSPPGSSSRPRLQALIDSGWGAASIAPSPKRHRCM